MEHIDYNIIYEETMYHSLIQILSAARLISREKGARIAELQENLGVSRSTVYRLIEALEELGYPCYDEEECGRERCIKLNQAKDRLKWWLPVPIEPLDFEDRILLDYMFRKTADTPALAEQVRNLQKKLAGYIAEGGCCFAEKDSGAGGSIKKKPVLLNSSVSVKASGDEQKKTINLMLEAVHNKNTCIVSYESFSTGTVKTFRIDPLALFEHEGGLYACVVVPYYGSVRILAVERIRMFEITTDIFTEPDNFDIEKRLSDPFGIILEDKPFTARIRFGEDQARYIKERIWPKGTSIIEEEDGSIIFSIETSGAYVLKKWILGFGPGAEVLDPPWLKKSLKDELEQTLDKYKN